MSPDERQLIDMAARISDKEERVERLESLEYGTLTFPAGGFIPICDAIIGPAAANSITLCPLGIPQTFKHLFVIGNYWSTSIDIPAVIGWAEMNFNGDFGARYFNHSRQELSPPGPPFILDGEVNPIGAGTDTKFSIPRPAQRNTIGVQRPTQVFILIPSYSRTTNFKTIAWWGQGTPLADEGGIGISMDTDQGGGEYRHTSTLAITSITFSHFGPRTFNPGSSWSLYGML